MRVPNNLYIIEYEENMFDTHVTNKVAMFNTDVISEPEVREYIECYMGMSYNPKIVTMTEEQYRNLFDVKPVNEKLVKEVLENSFYEEKFYADLLMEQKEQM